MKNLLLAASLLATCLTTACRKSAQTPDSLRAGSTETSKARPRHGSSTARTKETAKGDVRTALLHLQRVHFAYDSTALLPESREALSRAADALAAHPDVHVHVQGHTDDRGTDEYNLALGEKRAKVVFDYLVRAGIDASRLHLVTLGEELPLAPDDTADARAQNRRAEFELIRGDVQLVLDRGTTYDDDGQPLEVASLR